MDIVKKMAEFVRISKSRFPVKVTMLFLLIDLLFILIHIVVKVVPPLDISILKLTTPYGIPSFFQYGKELLIFLLLVYIFFTFRRNVMLYLSWALLFFFLLLYDAGEIQERLGDIQLLSNILGKLGSVIDEFAILLIISAVFGSIILFFYSRSTDEMSKQISKLYFILLGGFAFFAVGVDAIFTALAVTSETIIGKLVRLAFITLEEGGEMIVLSLMVGLTFGILQTLRQENTLEH